MDKNNKRRVRVAEDNPSIQRIEARCINCGNCMRICEEVVGINHEMEREDWPICINCGQCVMNCPVGALLTKYDYKKVLNIIHDTDKIVTLSVAPAVRVALGEEFGLSNSNFEGILPSLARALGFDYVFDISFGADITVMEEASELVERLTNKSNLPMFTSCCPSWVKYASIYHPELEKNISTTKSPIGIQSTLIKTYFKEFQSIDKNIISVVVAPCTSKKYEILTGDTDYIITTQELAMMVRESKIDIASLKIGEFDSLLSKGSKAGIMFGRSGGVMESILNYVHYLMTNEVPKMGQYHIEVDEPICSKDFKIGNKIIRCLVIYSMPALEKILPDMSNYDIIEVMNCSGGCVGGGGQPLIPIQKIKETEKSRKEQLTNEDAKVLYCFQNEDVIELYKSYLGKPMNDKAIALLHYNHVDMSHLNKN